MARLRADVLDHLAALALPGEAGAASAGDLPKESIRAMHAAHRAEVLRRELPALAPKWGQLLYQIANGQEVVPEEIDPEIVPVDSDEDADAELFRFASLLWSVPVSKGYGRRMRFLVRDQRNGKLIGIFALGDPVFNLKARDDWIGWDVHDRRARLVNVMDAYVLGAVPPYSQLLGGKLIAALIGSAEVNRAFAARYQESRGIISAERKRARLALVTVTSALGRSSLYNRVKLAAPRREGEPARTLVELVEIGRTSGFGHFQLSDDLFNRLRDLLKHEGHAYGDGHRFGQGPNWRIRVARVGLARIGLDGDLLRHGIARRVYAMPLAGNVRAFLRRQTDELELERPPLDEIAAAAIDRWILPRAERRPEYLAFRREDLMARIVGTADDARGWGLQLPLW